MQQAAPIWEVVDVRDSTMLVGSSKVAPSKVITVRLNTDQSTFSIEVPTSQFTATQVAKLIDEQANHELAVRYLKSPDTL